MIRVVLTSIFVAASSAALAQADSCTVAKCRQVQGKEGYTPAQTLDWCSRNVTNRGASACIPVPKAGAKR